MTVGVGKSIPASIANFWNTCPAYSVGFLTGSHRPPVCPNEDLATVQLSLFCSFLYSKTGEARSESLTLIPSILGLAFNPLASKVREYPACLRFHSKKILLKFKFNPDIEGL